MSWTFAITTDYSDPFMIVEMVHSINNLRLPSTEFECLVIGPAQHYIEARRVSGFRYIPFQEIKPGWVTRKKNILCQEALFENVLLMHDYFIFDPDWANQMALLNDEWDIVSCQQRLITGKRHFTDWVMWDHPLIPRYTAIDYNDWSMTKYQYISGGFFGVKRSFALQNPFNENMLWGQAEDVEWSMRVRNKARIKCQGTAIVTHKKWHRDAK